MGRSWICTCYTIGCNFSDTPQQILFKFCRIFSHHMQFAPYCASISIQQILQELWDFVEFVHPTLYEHFVDATPLILLVGFCLNSRILVTIWSWSYCAAILIQQIFGSYGTFALQFFMHLWGKNGYEVLVQIYFWLTIYQYLKTLHFDFRGKSWSFHLDNDFFSFLLFPRYLKGTNTMQWETMEELLYLCLSLEPLMNCCMYSIYMYYP